MRIRRCAPRWARRNRAQAEATSRWDRITTRYLSLYQASAAVAPARSVLAEAAVEQLVSRRRAFWLAADALRCFGPASSPDALRRWPAAGSPGCSLGRRAPASIGPAAPGGAA